MLPSNISLLKITSSCHQDIVATKWYNDEHYKMLAMKIEQRIGDGDEV